LSLPNINEGDIKVENKRAIVAFSMGVLPNGDPGITNEYLARVAELTHLKFGYPVLAEHEITIAIKSAKVVFSTRRQDSNNYRTTIESAKNMLGWLKKNDIKEVWIVAHPLLSRLWCRIFFKIRGFSVRAIDTGWIPLDKRSAQWWTRDPIRMIAYAPLALLQKIFSN
jgi:hypothetical protein